MAAASTYKPNSQQAITIKPLIKHGIELGYVHTDPVIFETAY